MTAAEAAATRVKTVSHNETVAGGRPKFAAAVLLDQKDDQNRVPVIKLGSGCSVGPSPDGSRLTRNLWETDKEHQTMKIHARNGDELQYLYIYDVLPAYAPTYADNPVKDVHGYTFNSQLWSSNSADIILVPAGRCFPQMYEDQPECSTMPWIYNLNTDQAFCLYDKDHDGEADIYTPGVWWYIRDFYLGKTGPVEQCNETAQCDDINDCTTEQCINNICVREAVANCCNTPEDCDDDDECTTETCEAKQCRKVTIAGCESGPTISIESPEAGAIVQAGGTVPIRWTTRKVGEVVLYLTLDDGENWDPIHQLDDRASDWLNYSWEIPADLASETCAIMVEDYSLQARAESGLFTIRDPRDPDPTSHSHLLSEPGTLVGSCNTTGIHSVPPAGWFLLLAWLGWRRRKAD